MSSHRRITNDLAVRRSHASDASGLELVPDEVARPTSAEEVEELMERAALSGTHVTAAGGQTSTTAASITDEGMLLSLRGLNRILDIDPDQKTVRAEAGVNIATLKQKVAEYGLLLACDPTSEEEATVGGAVACNASGARSLKYGAVRRHVQGLDVVLASGERREFKRPWLEKNTVGYLAVQDPVDWLIGSEGTLGVVLAATFNLLPLPERVTGLGISFDSEESALLFVAMARAAMEEGELQPRCLEYLDALSLELVRTQEGGGGWTGEGFVYAEEEHAGDTEPDYDRWLEVLEASGGREEDVRIFENDASIRAARRLRHAVPAVMHERSAPYKAAGGRRISTDWAVPYPLLGEAINEARKIVIRHGLEMPVIYGHAGNGHPHQNFIAKNSAEVKTTYQAVTETLEMVIGMGGTVAAEHGIGKVKRQWMGLQLSPQQVQVMRAMKHELDPLGILAPGNLFS